jgi:chemotaxis protein MotB
VAYADFVTALMALFIVLWMMNSSQRVKASVSSYFQDPRSAHKAGAGPANAAVAVQTDRRSVANLQTQIEKALRQMAEFPKIAGNVRFSVNNEGLRIDLLESEQGMFFVAGSPEPTVAGEDLLGVLAGQLAKLPNRIVIEGHTDSRPYRAPEASSHYGNWELSADRANAARRLLQAQGLAAERVSEVRGFADRKLLPGHDSADAANRRVSVVVLFLDAGV